MANTYRHGQFVLRELFTTDVDASVRFYTQTFGWKTEAITVPGGLDYTLVKVGDRSVAGIAKHPVQNLPAHWASSVSVDDVDATASRVTAAGGKVLAPPTDVGDLGRYAAFQDPQGALINVWHSNRGDLPAPERPDVGMFCWEQLNTTAPAEALAFYNKVFGWTNKPFGGAGSMRVFETGATGVASVMAAPPGVPAHWLNYVVVDKLASAYDRARPQGGQVMVERIDIPTVGAIGVIQDNVGAVIGVFEAPAG